MLDLRPAYNKDERSALSVAALYGANAAGKTTVLAALRFMHDAVLEQNNNWRPGKKIPRYPFMLDEVSPERPSSFQVELLLDGVRYAYGFTIDDEKVLEEWCISYPKKQPRRLFERDGDGINFGVTTNNSKSELLAEITPANMLFISTAARSKDNAFTPVYRWFSEKLWFLNPEDDSRYAHDLTSRLLRRSGDSEDVLSLLRFADLGIAAVETTAPVHDFKIGGKTPAKVRMVSPDGRQIDFTFDGEEEDLRHFLEYGNIEQRLRFTHAGVVNSDFGFEDESHGTRTWFKLVGITLEALRGGFTLVVDEIDTSLHPLLVARLIRLFQDPSINVNSSQLVLSTHDTSLMGRHGGEELLRRDEVWFVEKDHQTGASSLFSLTDFRPRDGLNWERRYLGGAVGAVPFVDDERLVAAARSYAMTADE
ncbi:ATP-binding protein [Kribbella sp. NPDC051718]|uniref:AAA family ATPase n=1 Tax=Kribbella sp. NPDC051718 TaxID=3155168 RepID=UPI00342D1258